MLFVTYQSIKDVLMLFVGLISSLTEHNVFFVSWELWIMIISL